MKRTSDRVAVAAMKAGNAFQKPTFDYCLQGARPCFVSCDANGQERFFDCANCPYMRAIPAGAATLGSPASEAGRGGDEPLPRPVRLDKPIAVSVFEVTISEWAACVRDRACRPVADWSHENPNPLLPVTGVSYAGSPRAPYRGYPEAVAAYPPNTYGLYHMAGNAWEWTEACADPRCGAHIARGGSFQSTPGELRVANRFAVANGKKRDDVGLRVVRDLAADEITR